VVPTLLLYNRMGPQRSAAVKLRPSTRRPTTRGFRHPTGRLIASERGCHERRGLELALAQMGNWLADRVTVNAEAVREFVHAAFPSSRGREGDVSFMHSVEAFSEAFRWIAQLHKGERGIYETAVPT
jgi:hypothetical protein